jgi:hypothetical protein
VPLAEPASGATTSPDAEPTTPAPPPAAVHEPEALVERGVPLAAEVALVDRARAALASGEPSRSLRELDRYEALFPERRLEPEVLYLRMEAHLLAGHDVMARETAERSVRLFPKGPHAARARQILEK